jgi:hypothetical protein
MPVRSVKLFALSIAAGGAAFSAALAQGDNTVRINAALEGDKRPFLCRDRDSVNLIIPIVARAQEARARGESDKAQSLMQVAERLQAEICQKPVAEDVVILRCRVDQKDALGGAVSTVKVGAILRSDPTKVEQPFFAWTRASIDEGGAAGASCPGEGGGEALQVSPDIILRVQQRLYDFGLRMSDINGRLSDETTQNLHEFQKYASLPNSGQLTKQTLEKLFTMPAPSPWVTFAFDGYGNYAATTGGTRRNAELGAIEQLQRRSRSDFKVSSVAAPNCLGFAVTRYVERGRRSRTRFTQAFTSVGDSVDNAGRNAINFCERDKGGGECEIRYILCATGEDIRDSQFAHGEREGREERDPRRGDRRDRRDRRDSRDGDNQGEQSRSDTKNLPVNSRPPTRFDPSRLPLNDAPPSDLSPSRPNRDAAPEDNNPGGPPRRFDPKNIPANSQPQ